MSMKSILDAFVKKTFLDKNGRVSTTKTGAAIAGAGAFVLGLPAAVAAMAIPGVVLVLPVVVTTGAKAAMGIGAYIATIGARDAIDKNKQ
jgi:hypothetical protein